MDPAEVERPGIRDAREALESIETVRVRRGVLAAPRWLHWGLGLCMVVEGLAQLVSGGPRIVVEILVLVAIFALSFAAQRRSGVVSFLTRPPRRPGAVWVLFAVVVIAAVALTRAVGQAGWGPLGYVALGVVIVVAGPRLRAIWGRLT